MKERYEVKESRIKMPFVGNLIARALGEAYVENGGFREGKRSNGVIYVGEGDERMNLEAVRAYIGERVAEIVGEGDYADALRLHYLAEQGLSEDARRVANFRRAA
ncbi:hypothetical protein AUJ84_01395 [Candidatus Pacearchaeota archaeon CG1_02_32_132]|nr:MAG: hypothetical protein AUJ84_01395 [Candidatus Pacearchaeota archaeon CG1_02_32_132]